MSNDFASTKTVTARKRHVCEECFRSIAPAETYHRTAGSWEGDFFTTIACAHCHVFRKWIDHADDGYRESYFGGASAWVDNGYWSAGDLPGTTWSQRLALYRMARHFRDHWRLPNGSLLPVPKDLPQLVVGIDPGAPEATVVFDQATGRIVA